MIFIDTKRFSPVIYGGDLPDRDDYYFKRPEEITKEFLAAGDYFIDEQWWHVQRDRCLNGFEIPNAIDHGGDFLIDGKDVRWYGNDVYIPLYDLYIKNKTVWIPGRMYWYLNFWPIYAKKQGKISKTATNPKYLAIDYFFYMRVVDMIKYKRDCQELKARQLGFSEKGSGGILGYNYTFIDDSLNIIVAGEQDDADKTFDSCKKGLNYLKNTQFYKQTSVDNSNHIRSKNTGSEIWALTAKDDPQTLSRFSPFWVWYEEIGKGKKGWSIDVNRYVKPSIITEGEKTGWQHYIGTAGEMDEGVYDLELRHFNPDAYNVLSYNNLFDDPGISNPSDKVAHFTGKQWYQFVDDDGNPQWERSIQWITDEYDKLTDPEEKYKFLTQYAYYTSHAFMATKAGFFGEEIVQLLSRRNMEIISNSSNRIVRRGKLKLKEEGKWWSGVEWTPDENGWLSIIEEPEQVDLTEEEKKDRKEDFFLNLYWGGLDSYDQDEAKTSNSKGSLHIRKTFRTNSKSAFYNCYVAEVVERPSVAEGGAELFYEHSALTLLWYRCQVNIEYSNLRIFQWFEDHGLTALLMERPKMAFAGKILNSQMSNRYGTDKNLKPQILAILKDRLTADFISRMFFSDQIMALAKYRYDASGKRYNCDITISTAEAEVAAKEKEFSVVKRANDTPLRKGYLVTRRDASGQLITKIV